MRIWKRRAERAGLKIFYAADIHGSPKCFGKLLNAVKFYGVDALIFGGDLTGKGLVPIVQRNGNSHEANFLGRRAVVHNEEELSELERNIRFNGFYPYRCKPGELQELQRDKSLRNERFERVLREDVARWVKMADERLRDSRVPFLAMSGNDDEEFVADILSTSRVIEYCDEQIVDVGEFQVLSLGYSNPTPWHTPRELPEEELEARIERLADKLEPGKPIIFNLHAPPYNSGLDSAPEIDENLRLVGGAAAAMIPVGSTAVRRVIEKYQPVISLHGHIHESRGAARIGRSVALNPGSEYNVGVLRGVIAQVRPDGVTGYQFVAA